MALQAPATDASILLLAFLPEKATLDLIVADASPLIVLAKVGRLFLLRHVYEQVLLGPTVFHEVVDQGQAAGASEVEFVRRASEERWIRRARLSEEEKALAERLLVNVRLDRGEAESIALAHSRGLRLVVDDKEGRITAQALRVPFVGTVGVVLGAFERKQIEYAELEVIMGELAKVLWISPIVIAEALKRARQVRS